MDFHNGGQLPPDCLVAWINAAVQPKFTKSTVQASNWEWTHMEQSPRENTRAWIPYPLSQQSDYSALLRSYWHEHYRVQVNIILFQLFSATKTISWWCQIILPLTITKAIWRWRQTARVVFLQRREHRRASDGYHSVTSQDLPGCEIVEKRAFCFSAA